MNSNKTAREHTGEGSCVYTNPKNASGDIQDEMSLIDKEISKIFNSVGSLQDRLLPVSLGKPSDPQGAELRDEISLSPIGYTLREYRLSLHQINSRIQQIVEDLEV